ncbi:MAG: hypothetical protein Q4A35_00810 [Candidatus Gracilibacteria bacterium]|nr:hypothetical protein [Candidatus Gracilibacteria bacterium]
MNENPGAYNEARNRLREEKERERKVFENLVERFEKEKTHMRAEKKFDIFELKSRIETHRSLNTLRSDIDKALREGIISREMFDTLKNKIEFIEHFPEKNILTKQSEKAFFDDEDLPFGKAKITKFFEKKKIGENILVDIGGFFYGFVVQGGAIFVILLWKILLDIIFLPRDILKELQK